ncbi:MAG TPA: alpha/beta hydrolase [Limnobacter sp.]|uniref:alpha/beta fold hydrolase n=1 Tax=Limnobacter sp. TaxID=2003368 RepID=UPI002EDAFE67
MHSISLSLRCVVQRYTVTGWLLAMLGVLLLGACKVDALPSDSIYSGNGVRLSIAEYGNPNGPPVLFIHGLAESGDVWQAQTHAPALQEYRLITMDLRGHGQSSKPMEPSGYLSANVWADDVFAVIHHLGLRNVTLVAHGHGAAVALDYLALYGEQRTRSVMLVDAITHSEPSGKPDTHFQGLVAKTQPAQVSGVLAWAQDNLGNTVDRTVYGRWVANAMLTPVPLRRYVLGRQVDHRATLQALRVPLLFAQGQQDPLVPLGLVQDLVDSTPMARLTVFHQSFHAPFATEAAAFNAALIDLVQQSSPRS